MADIELVIKIDEEDYKAIKNMSVVGDMTIPYVFNAIRNGTPILSNATNGIAVEAVFPNIEITEVDTYKGIVSVELDWWNSQYKK